MKYFIEDVTATGYNTKNDKGSELFCYLADKYRKVILDSEDEISNIIDDINHKIGELNEKYPRLKQNLKAELQEFKYCDFDEIVVKWDDKNHTTCCVIKMCLAKGIIVDGVVQPNKNFDNGVEQSRN